jgi:hypothetical protein
MNEFEIELHEIENQEKEMIEDGFEEDDASMEFEERDTTTNERVSSMNNQSDEEGNTIMRNYSFLRSQEARRKQLEQQM